MFFIFRSHPIIINYTRVVPKLVLTLYEWTCNVIYRNSDEKHVFCSSLSFQGAPVDVCIQIDLELQLVL